MVGMKCLHDLTPKGPNTQYLHTWDLGNSKYSTGFGQVYDYWVLGPSGYYTAMPQFPGYKLLAGVSEGFLVRPISWL